MGRPRIEGYVIRLTHGKLVGDEGRAETRPAMSPELARQVIQENSDDAGFVGAALQLIRDAEWIVLPGGRMHRNTHHTNQVPTPSQVA